MKKLLYLAMICVLTQNVFASSSLLGDVNLDGELTALDASLVLQYVLNSDSINLSEEQLENARVSDSDEITSLNASVILSKVLNNDFAFSKENELVSLSGFIGRVSDYGLDDETVLKSREELETYIKENSYNIENFLYDNVQKYDSIFFENNNLLIKFLDYSGTWNDTYELKDAYLNNGKVEINYKVYSYSANSAMPWRWYAVLEISKTDEIEEVVLNEEETFNSNGITLQSFVNKDELTQSELPKAECFLKEEELLEYCNKYSIEYPPHEKDFSGITVIGYERKGMGVYLDYLENFYPSYVLVGGPTMNKVNILTFEDVPNNETYYLRGIIKENNKITLNVKVDKDESLDDTKVTKVLLFASDIGIEETNEIILNKID